MKDKLARLVMRVFSRRGSLRVTTPDGRSVVLGSGDPRAELTVADRSAYRRIAATGALGFAEAYLDGEIETPDLERLLEWGAINHGRWGGGRLQSLVAPLRRLWQRVAPDRRHVRVQTMVDHYNVGNDFYRTWLDASMTYSAARFTNAESTLELAQEAKYRAIAERAGLQAGQRVLEIGCGWGGFACFAAAEYGVSVVGLTVSKEQAEFARERIIAEGLSHQVEIVLEDFRSHEGVYDAVVSIEMIESVDESVWPELFRAFHDCVSTGGRGVMQAITIDDGLYDGYRHRQDFIQRYIFPGCQVPAPGVIARLAESAGLEVTGRETFGLDYARTLELWADRFRTAWPELALTGLDDRFRRMWEFYLAYCEAGFRTGAIDVGQWSFTRG